MSGRAVRKSRRGATIVEAAFALGICLYLMLGLFDFARVVMTRQLLDNAVREAARLAIANTTTLTTQDIQNSVMNHLAGAALQTTNVQVYKADPATGANIGAWTDAGLGQCIAVEFTGNLQPMLPKISFVPSPLLMTAKSVMFSEANYCREHGPIAEARSCRW
jgi:Flp pilus assembly protein TadG